MQQRFGNHAVTYHAAVRALHSTPLVSALSVDHTIVAPSSSQQ